MTEAEWLECEDPDAILKHLASPSARKLRLFALACCSRIDHLITDPRSREAIEFAEKHVETPIERQRGRATRKKAAYTVWKDAYAKAFTVPLAQQADCLVASSAADTANVLLDPDPVRAAEYSASFACFAVAWGIMGSHGRGLRDNLTNEAKAPEQQQQAHLLRCIFGNPFRPVALDPAWRTSTVVQLAQGIYDDRAFDQLPILADALQDAGCDNGDVLNHCRDTGPHARGCWVVDLILDKA